MSNERRRVGIAHHPCYMTGLRRYGYPPALLIFVTLMLSACGQTPPVDALREGQLFPPLHLTGLDRDDIDIDDLRGSWIVLNVWATWCGPCREELASLQQLDRTLADQPLMVIGLNVDSDRHIAREFLLDQSITFANFSDPEMFIAKQLLGIRAFPDTFIIAPDGTLWRSISGERDWASPGIREILLRAIAGQVDVLQTL